MSEPNPSSSAAPGAGSSSLPGKRRSPIERILVWGLIIVMVGLVSVEAFSKFSYEATIKDFEKLKEKSDKANEPATSDQYDDLVAGMPSRVETDISIFGSTQTRIDYTWFSLFRTYNVVLSGSSDDEGKLWISNFDTNLPLPDMESTLEDPELLANEHDHEADPNQPSAQSAHGGPAGGHGGPGAGPRGEVVTGGPMGSVALPEDEESRPELESPDDEGNSEEESDATEQEETEAEQPDSEEVQADEAAADEPATDEATSDDETTTEPEAEESDAAPEAEASSDQPVDENVPAEEDVTEEDQ